MAAKFFTGLPLDGPDPECVKGHGEAALAAVVAGSAPKPSLDHSRRSKPVQLTLGPRPETLHPPVAGNAPACDPNPLAGFRPPRQ
jgi:hypothetical protein